MVIKVAIVAESMNGPDIFFTKVDVDERQYKNGEHYDIALEYLSDEQVFESKNCIVIDEHDPAKAIMTLCEWDTIPVCNK